jgi:hypothetical protein
MNSAAVVGPPHVPGPVCWVALWPEFGAHAAAAPSFTGITCRPRFDPRGLSAGNLDELADPG